eukprot:CAMPEP_0184366372 /NCGR_PEP_ID=MMETSP1089-20130417/153491_1 /TAXON_ID=38269 ORGANISM="Gloeochaete wittrockiana, Strain SAG46.84" /NCGR_SAMPLE_ID=MMETSP1089 /ASSEMBLY_ACC=CAM_ASM_000445 /LENGTH=40 /DNA_ID= /DNA_START= /DNA_END= /DNA_ORIENTATION=
MAGAEFCPVHSRASSNAVVRHRRNMSEGSSGKWQAPDTEW